MSRRYDEMDIVRGIAIIAVILIHISSTAITHTENLMHEQLAILINQITRFAVPLFLLLSGWGLTISKKYNQNYFVFLKNQLSKILVWYLFWNTISSVTSSDSYTILGFIKGILFGTSFYHLYYVPLIVILYIAYPVIYKYFSSNIGLIIVLCITILSQCADFFVELSILNNPLNVLNWLFFFVAGIWLAKDFGEKIIWIHQKSVLWIIFFIVIGLLLVLETNFTIDNLGNALSTTSMRPSVIFFSIVSLLAFISIKWAKGLKNYLINLAKMSYGIYLSHVFILIIFDKLWVKMGLTLSGVLYVLISFLVVLVISYFVSVMMDMIENRLSKLKIHVLPQ